MQTVVKWHFWAVQGQPVPAPTQQGTCWSGQGMEEEKVGEELCLLAWHSQPSLRGCSQARGRGPAFCRDFCLFMVYFMISYRHVRFHKLFMFRKCCDLRSVTVPVTFGAATCSGGCCLGTPSCHLPNSQWEWGLAALQWSLRPQPFLQSLLPPT